MPQNYRNYKVKVQKECEKQNKRVKNCARVPLRGRCSGNLEVDGSSIKLFDKVVNLQ
jgi:hypothetical protein